MGQSNRVWPPSHGRRVSGSSRSRIRRHRVRRRAGVYSSAIREPFNATSRHHRRTSTTRYRYGKPARGRPAGLLKWIRQKWAPWIDPDAKVESVEVVDEGGIDATGTFQHPRAVRLVGLAERRDERGKLLPPAYGASSLRREGTHPAQNVSARSRSCGTVLPQRLVHTLPRACTTTRRGSRPSLNMKQTFGKSTRSDISNSRATGQFVVDAARCSDANGVASLTQANGYRIRISRVTSDVGIKPPRSQAQRIPIRTGRADFCGALVPKAITLSNGDVLPPKTILIKHLASCRFGPGERDAFIKTTADQDGGSSNTWTAGPRRRGRWRRCRISHAASRVHGQNRDRQREQGSSFSDRHHPRRTPKALAGIWSNRRSSRRLERRTVRGTRGIHGRKEWPRRHRRYHVGPRGRTRQSYAIARTTAPTPIAGTTWIRNRSESERNVFS